MHTQDTTQKLNGHFHLEIRRAGQVVAVVDEKNLVVDAAKPQLARLIGGDGANRAIAKIGFGTGTGAPAPANTALTGTYAKSIASVSYPAPGEVQFQWTLDTDECVGMAISEFGLLCADNTLFARKQRAVIEKDSDMSLTGAWTIVF